jgi:hypothetical protein
MENQQQPEHIEIKVSDGLNLNDDDLVRLRTSSEDHFVERKSFGDWEKDALKTVVAFSNSLPVGLPGVLFIGVKDKGDVDPRSQDLDSVQKTLARRLKAAYPPITYVAKGMKEGSLSYLAVIVYGSAERPHFAGPSYVRTGSSTEEASEAQFRELVAQRQSKVRELLKWKGEEVSVQLWLPPSSGLHGTFTRGQELSTRVLRDCNEFYLTVEGLVMGKPRLASYPLSRTELSFDHDLNKLRLEISE